MTSSPAETDLQRIARQAAIDVEENFANISSLRNDDVAAMIAVFDSEEIAIEKTLNSGIFTISGLRGISVRYGRDPPFDEEMEDMRHRFAERSHKGYFAVKCVSREAIEKDEETTASTAAALIVEAKILMNLEKHPHICQLYGLNANGTDAWFGGNVMEEEFFLIIDAISETLPERMKAWREKKCYEGERFDDLATRQSQLTQRLEVALDICSAMTFLSNRNIVYFLHPEKVGFDARYKRIKLFQFGHARESGRGTFFNYEEADMMKRVYLAPEVLRHKDVTISADVYAFGILLWETLTLRHPFEGMSIEAHLTHVINGRTRPYLNKTWPNKIRNLIENCWAPSSRPTMKEVYDDLESCLLFQDLGGIDRTEDHDRAQSKSRKIRYQRTAEEPITEEERERDGRSVKSKDSLRSKESQRSKDSVSRRSERSSRSHDSGENGSRSGKSSSRRSHDKSPCDDRSGRQSSNKTSAHKDCRVKVPLNDAKECNDGPSSRSVKGKDGKVHRRPSESKHKQDDGDDRTASSDLKSVTSKDGKNCRLATEGGSSRHPHADGDDRTALSGRKSVKGNDGKIRRKTTEDGPRDDGDDRTASSEKRSMEGKDGKIRRRTTESGSCDDGDGRTTTSEKRSVQGKDGRIRRARPSTRRSSRDGGSLRDAAEALADEHSVDSADAKDAGSSRANRLKQGPLHQRSSRRLSRAKSYDGLNEVNGGGRQSPARGVNKSHSSDDGLLRQSSFIKINRRVSNSGENSGDQSKNDCQSRKSSRVTRQSSCRRLGRNKSEELTRITADKNTASARRLVGRSRSSDDLFGGPRNSDSTSGLNKGLGFVAADRKTAENLLQDMSEHSKWIAFGSGEEEEEPDRRGKLTETKSGLLKPATKDTAKGNRARSLKEKSSATNEDKGSSAIRNQRSSHVQSRPILVAAKEKSFAKRKPKSRRSLITQDKALLKGVFVDG